MIAKYRLPKFSLYSLMINSQIHSKDPVPYTLFTKEGIFVDVSYLRKGLINASDVVAILLGVSTMIPMTVPFYKVKLNEEGYLKSSQVKGLSRKFTYFDGKYNTEAIGNVLESVSLSNLFRVIGCRMVTTGVKYVTYIPAYNEISSLVGDNSKRDKLMDLVSGTPLEYNSTIHLINNCKLWTSNIQINNGITAKYKGFERPMGEAKVVWRADEDGYDQHVCKAEYNALSEDNYLLPFINLENVYLDAYIV